MLCSVISYAIVRGECVYATRDTRTPLVTIDLFDVAN